MRPKQFKNCEENSAWRLHLVMRCSNVIPANTEILFNAALNIKGVPGAVVEIGTRRGGSAKLIMDALVTVGDAARSMFVSSWVQCLRKEGREGVLYKGKVGEYGTTIQGGRYCSTER